MAGGAKSTSATGEHKEVLVPTVGTADSGKSAAGVAAVEAALHNWLDDRAEEAVLFLEAAPILHLSSSISFLLMAL